MVVMSCFGSKDCTSLVKYKVKTKRGCAQVAYPPLFFMLNEWLYLHQLFLYDIFESIFTVIR